VDNGHQKVHSVSLQSSQGVEELRPVRGLDQGLEGILATRETGQASETGEVVGGRFGITQETEDEAHRPLVQGGIRETRRVGRGRHHQVPESLDLRVGNGDATADPRGQDRLALEEALDHSFSRAHQAGLMEDLPKSVEKLLSPSHLRGDENHRGVESIG
jgi:hypothetical protein